MNQEKLYESLSALMDGEAGELELHQVLKQSQNAQVREQWQRWQMVRSTLRGQPQSLESLDLAARVSAALDTPVVPVTRAKPVIRLGLWGRAGQLAVAASVAFVVLGGVRFYQSLQATSNGSPLQAQQGAGTPFNLPLAETPQLAGFGGNIPASTAQTQLAPQWTASQLDWQAEHLPVYLHQHYQQGGLYQGLEGVLHARSASFGGD